MHRIGIDLGGTKIEGILIDGDGNTIERKRVPTQREDGYEAIISRIADLGHELLIKSTGVKQIGICTPGAIDPSVGVMKNSNTLCLIGKPLQQDLEDAFDLPVFMENDANCFALAEATLGAAKGFDVVFGVIMGTGVGGGIVLNGKIHQGPNHIAGEWGHHVLYPDGRDCYCGNKGCTESYISGPALEKEWEALTGQKQMLTDIIEQGLYKYHSEWKENFLLNFGRALSNVIDILDPNVIVLGGGLSNIDFLYTEGKDAVYREAFSDHVLTPILKNKLGDSAGVYGAAFLGE
ncbi:MAG: ROK family protein [Candidatus Marinimicrobia bacterium]|nr:ROK family protein [Candidatus Neomarinimicrobiota bacterium]